MRGDPLTNELGCLLRGIKRSVLRDSARQVDCVFQVRLTRGAVLPGHPNFPAHPNCRSRLKIVAAEYTNGVEPLQLRRRCRICQSHREIKTLDAGAKVRRV